MFLENKGTLSSESETLSVWGLCVLWALGTVRHRPEQGQGQHPRHRHRNQLHVERGTSSSLEVTTIVSRCSFFAARGGLAWSFSDETIHRRMLGN